MIAGRLPTLMIPHGGGPCFFMSPEPVQPPSVWDGLAAHLRGLKVEVGALPKAILMISAHWETSIPTVLEAPFHSLFFDYSGFPEHTYRLTYPAPGAPETAARARALLDAAGIPNAGQSARGLDHGVFIPLMLMYPQADIPVFQLSLLADMSPEKHLEIGRAIAPLRDEGVLIVGSGMTFHNLSAFRRGGPPQPEMMAASRDFDAWLAEVATAGPAEREAGLKAWARAPGARQSHPREEHLMPLMVAAGAGGEDRGRRIYSERLGGSTALSGFRFG